jgi:multidrug resistance efflux pump
MQKESGYVQKLYVDYGTRVKAGQVMAVLEIPELETQIEQDEDAIQNAIHQVAQAQKELDREEAQRNVTRLQFTRCGSFACAPECRRAD